MDGQDNQQQVDFDALQSDFMQHLAGKGYIVKPQGDYDTDLSTARKDEANKATSNAYNSVDQSILELTGVQKNAGEKTTDYQRRAIEVLKAGKPDGQGQQGNSLENGQIEALKKQVDEMQKKMKGQEEENNRLAVSNAVKEGFAGGKLTMPLDDAQTLLQSKFKAKREGGQVFFENAAGVAQVHADGTPKTSLELVKEFFPYALEKDLPGNTGSGTQTTHVIGTNGYLGASKGEIQENLAKEGLIVGSEKWTEKYNAAVALLKK